jgi:hypothetical protein
MGVACVSWDVRHHYEIILQLISQPPLLTVSMSLSRMYQSTEAPSAGLIDADSRVEKRFTQGQLAKSASDHQRLEAGTKP